jgi:hypothetical protein
MNFRTVGELRGGRGDHPSEEALAKPVKESDLGLATPGIDAPERQTPPLGRNSLPEGDRQGWIGPGFDGACCCTRLGLQPPRPLERTNPGHRGIDAIDPQRHGAISFELP